MRRSWRPAVQQGGVEVRSESGKSRSRGRWQRRDVGGKMARPRSSQVGKLGGAVRLDWNFWHKASVFGLLAGECRRGEPGRGECAHFEPTGRLGAGWRGEGYTLFANVSRYQRQPSLGELHGAGVVVRGNAALRPELGLSADAGARGWLRLSDWLVHAESSVFVRGASDLVTYARAAQGYVVPVNVGRARVAGLELGVGARGFDHVEVGCNLSLLDPRDTTPGRRLGNEFLPFMSRLVWRRASC